MKKLLLAISILFTYNHSKGQCNPVLKVMSQQPGYYMTGHYDYSFPYYHKYTNLDINKSDSSSMQHGYFDGNNWVRLNNHVIVGQPLRLLMWGNRLMGYGKISRINGIQSPAQKYFAIMEYKNGAWDTIPGGLLDSSIQYLDASASSTGLYLRLIGTNPADGTVFQYDTSSNAFVKLFDYSESDYVRCHLIAGQDRVVLTNVGKINNVSTNGFAYMENDTFYRVSASGYSKIMLYAIDKTNDRVYAYDYYTNKKLYEFGNNTLSVRNLYQDLGSPYSPLHVYNGKVVWFAYEPTNNSDCYYNIVCPGDSICKNICFFKSAGVMSTNPYCAKNGIYTDIYYDNIVKSVELTEGALLEGVAFIDNDSNCNPDSGEHRLKNYFVHANSDNYFTSAKTDDTGHYKMFVGADTVVVKGSGNLPACAGINSLITTSSNSYTKHVPIMQPNGYDVSVKLISTSRVRWNTGVGYGAIVENHGYPVDSVDVTITLDSNLNVLSGNSVFHTLAANKAYATLAGMDYFEKRWINISSFIDTGSTKPDSILCHDVAASIDSVELDYANNTDSSCQLVVYSYDPNIKLCAQKKILPGISTRLDYYIEFQNEGNDDAYDVVVVDPMSNKLDYETFRITAVSHPYTYEFKNGQLVITFKNIYLKPKKVDEAASRGYIKFSIYTKPGLVLGDSIVNKALIYFDLNKPVITDPAVVKIEQESSLSPIPYSIGKDLKLYPNPAFDLLNIELNVPQPVYIFNSMGQLIAVLNPDEELVTLDISNYQSGVYFVRSGESSVKFIKY